MSDQVKEVSQARATTAKLATLTGKAGQLIIRKDDWRIFVMDSVTAGGHEVANALDVTALGENLSGAIIDAVDSAMEAK